MAGMHQQPLDIVFGIFARVPTKPLLRFRSISKHWNRLISDYFTKSRSRRMILLPFEPLQTIDLVPGDTTANSTFELPYPFKNPETKDVIIVGAFNGIVLLVLKNKNMILYNPLTGAVKIIPNPPLEPSNYISIDAYGFCGTTLEDLKIVVLSLVNGVYISQASRWCDVYVFSLKKGSWSTKCRRLVGWSVIDHYAGTFVNGFLYWVAGSLIVSLDVKEMVFYAIQLPRLNGLKRLGKSGGRLHVFSSYDAEFELWVMKEHGIEKPWSKVCTSNALSHVYPMSVIDKGSIVMLKIDEKQKQVIIYDMLKDSYEAYEVNPRIWEVHAMEYVGSLISPSDLCSSW